MLTRLQIQNYRGIKALDVPLQPFQVLIGPNGSGKSTFFDAILFLRDALNQGVVKAIHQRADYYEQLTFGQNSEPIKMALEFSIPENIPAKGFQTIRYEVGFKTFREENKYDFYFEHVQLIQTIQSGKIVNEPFSTSIYANTLDAYSGDDENNAESVFRADRQNNEIWLNTDLSEKSEAPELKYLLLPRFENLFLPYQFYWKEDEYPVINWLSKLLTNLTGAFDLETKALKNPQKPGEGIEMKNNGENFPFVFESFQKDHTTYQEWLGHLQTALPELKYVHVKEYPADRSRYLVLEYQNGNKIPSWLASDGTLKFLFLTMLAYSNLSNTMKRERSINMIEEVENGLHPQAIESLLDSLSSVWDSNVMVTTHSPVVLNYKDMKPENLLIFNYSEKEGVQVQPGTEHTGIQEWKDNITFREMLSSGIL